MPRHANTHSDHFSHGRIHEFPAELIAAYRPLHAAGLIDREAAAILGKTTETVCRLRNRLGLASNKPKTPNAEALRRQRTNQRAKIDALENRLTAIILALNARGLTDFIIAARLRGTPDETSVQRITRIRNRLALPSHTTTPAAVAARNRVPHVPRPIPPPPEPTEAPPGSIDKLQIMAARAADGFQVFHPLDNRGA